jgi:hypothetical protein
MLERGPARVVEALCKLFHYVMLARVHTHAYVVCQTPRRGPHFRPRGTGEVSMPGPTCHGAPRVRCGPARVVEALLKLFHYVMLAHVHTPAYVTGDSGDA